MHKIMYNIWKDIAPGKKQTPVFHATEKMYIAGLVVYIQLPNW